jgi:HK97 family phage major capsid protein
MELKEAQRLWQAEQTAIEQITSKYANKSEAFSPEDRTALTDHLTKAEGLAADIENIQRVDKQKAWGQARPGEQPPIKLHGQDGEPGKVYFEGSYESGLTVFDRSFLAKEKSARELRMIYQEGEFGVDPQKLGAMSTKDYRDAFRTYLRKDRTGMSSNELKTLQEGVDTAGGFLVPPDIANRIISKLPTPTRVAGRVTRLQTMRDRLIIPKVNYTTDDIYTTGIRVTASGEVPSSATVHRVTDPAFGQVTIPIHTFMLSMPITLDMIEDSSFPLVEWASGKFNETVDLYYDDRILNGSGINQPGGILLNPGGSNQPAVVVSGSSSAVLWAGLENMAFAIPEQYDDDCAWVMNKTNTALAISKLLDTTNRPFWNAGYNDTGLIQSIKNRPLLGYPVLYSGFMPNVAANAYPYIFGDLKAYYHVDRVGFSIQVLRELYAESNQILLLGRLRFGGQVAEDWRVKIGQIHT